MPRIVAIIQARMGSTRLPGKVLMEIGPKTVLQHLIDRIKRVPLIDEVVVATTIHPRDVVIAELCQKLKIPVHRGSEEDVLLRYAEAVKKFQADIVFRATSDEPYKDPQVMEQILKVHIKKNADYTCNHWPRTFPDGSTVEIMNRETLERVNSQGKQRPDREHVTFYIYNHPKEFKIQNVEAVGKLRRPDLRYCLDTEQDLKVIRAIFDHLGEQGPYFTVSQIIDFLDEHQEVRKMNEMGAVTR